ncbi:MAG TPA: hypothetical protein VH477_04910 [Bryobacteraceae bacterium]
MIKGNGIVLFALPAERDGEIVQDLNRLGLERESLAEEGFRLRVIAAGESSGALCEQFSELGERESRRSVKEKNRCGGW